MRVGVRNELTGSCDIKEVQTMQRVLGFIGHLISAMLKGFFFTGGAAAILCAVVLFVTEPNHQVQLNTSMVFGMTIALLAGIVGAAVALIYHLSHLDSLHHTVRHYSEMRGAQRDRQSLPR
jgi:putative exporter of polyketide antibiotics